MPIWHNRWFWYPIRSKSPSFMGSYQCKKMKYRYFLLQAWQLDLIKNLLGTSFVFTRFYGVLKRVIVNFIEWIHAVSFITVNVYSININSVIASLLVLQCMLNMLHLILAKCCEFRKIRCDFRWIWLLPLSWLNSVVDLIKHV